MKLLTYSVMGLSCLLLSTLVVAETKLNAQQVRALFSNNTVNSYHELKKVSVSLFYNKNGKVSGLFSNGKLGSSTWSVNKSGEICVKVKAKNVCFEVMDNGGSYKKYMVKSNGQRVLVFSTEMITKGNVNNY